MNTLNNTYMEAHRTFLKDLLTLCQQQAPFNTEPPSEEITQFLETLKQLVETDTWPEELREQGSNLICQIVSNYPHITPHIARDLFWFFGGQCLHYMPDDEIAQFQRLDEARYEAESQNEVFDYKATRNQVFGLH